MRKLSQDAPLDIIVNSKTNVRKVESANLSTATWQKNHTKVHTKMVHLMKKDKIKINLKYHAVSGSNVIKLNQVALTGINVNLKTNALKEIDADLFTLEHKKKCRY